MLEHNRNDGVNVTRGHSNDMTATLVEDDHAEWSLVQGKGKKRHGMGGNTKGHSTTREFTNVSAN